MDVIEAFNNPGEKYCTHCGIKKPLDQFHLDSTKPDGRRDCCRDCRNEIKRGVQKQTLNPALVKIETEGFETLKKLTDGGSIDPHINEVFEAMLKPFGGVNGWAKHMFATYLACEPGSQKRVKMHDMMLQLAGKVTKLGLAERQLDMMEERDLLQVMRQHITDYQQSNQLPSTAIPTLNGEVIDVAEIEEISEIELEQAEEEEDATSS